MLSAQSSLYKLGIKVQNRKDFDNANRPPYELTRSRNERADWFKKREFLPMISAMNLSPAAIALDLVGVVSVALLLAGMVTLIVKKYDFGTGWVLNLSLAMVVVGTILICNGAVGALNGTFPCFSVTLMLLGNGIVMVIGGSVLIFR